MEKKCFKRFDWKLLQSSIFVFLFFCQIFLQSEEQIIAKKV